jgi:DNA-binding NtrC family response regulator
MKKILIVDDDASLTYSLQKAFSAKYNVFVASCAASGMDFIRNEPDLGLVFLDYMLGEENGLDVLERIRKDGHLIPVIFMTAHGTSETVLEAVKLGAADFLVKPVSPDEFVKTVESYYSLPVMSCGKDFEPVPEYNPNNKFVGISRAIRDVLKLAASASMSNVPVLLAGESGTGKDLIANIIHNHGERAEMPFLAINCAAIPEELLESELFGYEQGAFSGAVNSKIGLLESANGGTVFLDEVSEMSFDLQAKLLRFLQNGTIQRLGELKEKSLDVKVIAATNKNLESLVDAGDFRFDLDHRLSVINILIPPLRERKEDIKDIALHLIAKHSSRHGKNISCVCKKLLNIFEKQTWAGNVREMENRIREAIILSKTNYLTSEDFKLKKDVTKNSAINLYNYFTEKYSRDILTQSIEECESELIKGALMKYDGKLSKVAEWLNISRMTLNSKIKKYNISED